MLKELALKWFQKNQYNTKALHRIVKVINPLLYLATPVVYISSKLSTKYYPHKFNNGLFRGTHLLPKLHLYDFLTPNTQDQNGFIDTDHCDATLFSGLLSASGYGKEVNMSAAKNDKNQWFRRPLNYPPCYIPGKKSSTISRDMMMGVFWSSWKNKHIGNSYLTYLYGSQNDWVMGEGDISRIYLTPGLRSTLVLIIEKTMPEISINHLEKYFPQSWPKGLEDYEAHLAMLHIELRGQLNGYIDSDMASCLIDIADRMHNNALAQLLYAKWVTGDFGWTIALLGGESIWPTHRLPTSHDRRESWITQRGDDSNGWLPAEGLDTKTHSGGDFLFCMMLLIGDPK